MEPGSKRKLLFVVHSLQMGGAERLVTQLAGDIDDEFEIGVCCLDHRGALWDECLDRGYRMFEINRSPHWQWRTFYEMAKVYRSFQPAVVHAHQYTPYFYSIAGKILARSKAPVIFTEHGRHVPDIVSSKRRLANRFLLRRTSAITAVSEFSRRALYQNEGLHGKQIEVIYNGLYPQPAPPQYLNLRSELGLGAATRIIGYVGSLRPVKNPLLLLNAFAAVSRAESDVALIFIGEGPLRSELTAEIQRLGLEQKAFLLGERNPAAPYYRDFTVFVLPSLCEAASLALLEAMSNAVPPIVTNVGGSPEIVDNGRCGILVDSSDVGGLADALIRLLDSAEERTAIGARARARVEQEFTFPAMVARYRALYESAV